MKILFDHSHGLIIDNRVFCQVFVVPENETYDDLIELGWLPCQPPIYWYQSKSCRVNYDKIKFSYKRKKIISSLSYEIIKYVDHKIEVDNFFGILVLPNTNKTRCDIFNNIRFTTRYISIINPI